jgi:error-prone DNA polymerase
VFAELHAASAFSFLEGASLPEVLAEVCSQLDIPAMAVLDRDGFYGSPRFHLAAQKRGIKAHVGAEVTCTDGARYPLLAESRKGYQNLCRLITRYKMRAPKGEGAATPEELAEFSEGLVCLAGGEKGPTLESAVLLFGPRQVYGELQRHYLRDEEARNQAILEKAARLHIPVIATNGVKHAVPSERQLLDALTCVREKVRLETAGKLLTRNAERYIKHEGKMRELFRDLPRAVDQTSELSDRLEFTLSDLGYRFPDYPVPPGETMASFLRAQAEKGAQDRYRPYHDRARQQIQRELELITKLHLEGYFLIVWDIVEFCRKAGILVQGRGSAANSAVCYALGITAVDPVGMDLLFERFLSEERGEWPDIDLDLPSGDRREKAIQFLYQKYGERGAAMTANVITYRGRSAAREIGKVLGFEESTVARLASLVRAWEWKDPNDTPERQFRDAGFDLADPHIRKFFELYLAAQDLPRHLGQHSGGMIVCQGRLDEVVPIENAAMPGRAVVQWDKDDCADMGMLKIDLLGLGMMAVLEDCLTIIRDTSGEEVSLAHLPPNDPKVYDALQRADTLGMFQVESRAQMATLPRMKPKTFYDIVVEVAIIRPGPIVGKMLHPYLRRRQGLEAPDALHPLLAPVLDRTLGVPIFQEQLLRMAMIVAGFSGGEAEELRRAFGFKRSEKRMAEVEVKLREGMNRNGITGEVQDRIIQSITSFALYGFPESHAASFALIAYASAYLKTHFLPAFTAAILNNQPMGFYHPATLVKDAQRHGLRVLPVDITKSNWLCTLEKQGQEWAMRLGFRYVRGLREQAGKAIEEERQHAPFTSIENLAGRVPELHRDELRMLAKVGALNFINHVHRRDALWEAERVSRPVGPLLGHLEAVEAHSPLRPMNVRERLHADFTGTGVTVGKHPMAFYREQLKRRGVLTAIDLKKLRDGSLVKVAGAVICRQRPGTAKGFFFISMEDETGISNVIVNPDQFEKNRQVLVGKSFLVVEGILQNWDGVSVKMGRVEALEQNPIPVPSHDFH